MQANENRKARNPVVGEKPGRRATSKRPGVTQDDQPQPPGLSRVAVGSAISPVEPISPFAFGVTMDECDG